VTDISEVSAPGAITNERLFDKDNPGRPRANLKLRIDYIGVNARVWWLFMHVHGGGPSICREELDIYSMTCSPEMELNLDELRGKQAVEYSRRISRQFVDECRGDLEAYNRKYGTDENAMQVDHDAGERIGGEDGSSELDDRVRQLTTEVDDLRRKKISQVQDRERQVIALRDDLQRCHVRQKALREAGATGNTWKVPKDSHSWQEQPHSADPEEQLAFEVHRAKTLQQNLDQLERELLALQRSCDESVVAKEDELRRSKQRAEEQTTQLHARQA